MMDKIRKAIQQGGYGDWAGALFLLAAVGMLLYAARLCFCDGIWYDELYTMGLAENSFRRLTALTAMDVHPPFYYYYVKTVQGLCRMAAPGLSAGILACCAPGCLHSASYPCRACPSIRWKYGCIR